MQFSWGWDRVKKGANSCLGGADGPITSWEIDGETVEAVSDFIFWGSKITAMIQS